MVRRAVRVALGRPSNWEGFVLHSSVPNNTHVDVWHTSDTYIDGTPDRTDPPMVHLGAIHELSIEQAESLVNEILRAVAEARG